MPPRKKIAPPGSVIGYVRVSTEDQANSGLGLDAQRDKISDEARRRDWTLVDVIADEGISAKHVNTRPGLLSALARIENAEAETLMVSKLDRLSRSVHDFTGLVDRAKRLGWSLVVLDLGVDTSTPSGAMMANVLASFAQFERELIGQRTSDALQAKKRGGAILGRPDRAADTTVTTVTDLRAAGRSLREIADELMDRGIPTAQGGDVWRPSSVAAVLRRPDAQRGMAVASDPAFLSWPPPTAEHLAIDGWDRVVAWQRDRCALCGDIDRLEKDHDHTTGRRRGLICKSCNRHEGSCGDPECRCIKYRTRPPTAMLAVDVDHGGWHEVELAERTAETSARTAKIRKRRTEL